MLIWLLNSKKCSIRNSSSFVIIIIAAFTFSNSGWCSNHADPSITQAIDQDISKNHSSNFEPLLKTWEHRYGTRAVPSLITLAQDHKKTDTARYLAIMAAAKIGGAQSAPLLITLLKDPVWMIRMASLRAMGALNNPKTKDAVLPLLKDSSLLVRLEAVDAVERLKPDGAAQALAQTLQDPANFHHGKAQWVPNRVVRALVALDARAQVIDLKPLLNFDQDPAIQQETVAALERLTRKKLKPEASLGVRVREWRTELSLR